MSRPVIDVLLPVLRARHTVAAALDDVLAQVDVDVRVLAVVDVDADGRDDGSRAWLRERAEHEPRLLVLDGPGSGAADALHAALARATAPFVTHMEADDRCPPERLARLVAALVEDDLAGVTSRVTTLGPTTAGMARYLAWQNELLTGAAMARERFVEIPALHQTGLYRREALLAVGGYTTRGPWPLDIDFWFRWFEHELPVAKLPLRLYHWRQHAGQSTRGGGLHALASLRAAKVDALARRHGRGGTWPRPLQLVSTGKTLDAWRRALSAADVELVGAVAWRPGAPPPPRVPGALLLAVYGTPAVRDALQDALRDALGRPPEPDELLFAA